MNNDSKGNKPALSVVIPTLGRSTLIGTVRSLLAADDSSGLEAIVAGEIRDEAVRREFERLTASDSRVRHLPVSFPSGDSSRKKNAGADASRADLVAFLDDDVVVARDWPARIVKPFEDARVGLVSGPGLIPDDLPLVGRLAGLALSSRASGYVAYRYVQGHAESREITWSRIIGCNMAYRRNAFEAIGKFDPAFWPGEEMKASHAAQARGYILVFVPDAWVYHYPRQSLGHFWRQIAGYGATRIRLFRAGVEFEPTTLVPAAWVLSLAVLGAGAFFSGWCRALLLADVGLYLLADALITAEKVVETRKLRDALLFLLIPYMHICYGWAEWVEFFRPGRDLSVKSKG